MAFDAVILSGGRASRLGGTAKATLLVDGRPLVIRALEAASGARTRVVVGDVAPGMPDGVLVTRESPAYGGPAAALGAGFAALLESDPQLDPQTGPVTDRDSDLVLVLACDMPWIGSAVTELLAAAASDPTCDGALAVDGDRARQYLAAVFRRRSLAAALTGHSLAGSALDGSALDGPALDGLSMRRLIRDMTLAEVPVATHLSADVDTWSDVERLAVEVDRSEHEEMTIG